MKTINTVLKKANTVLFTDSEHFQIEVTGLTLSEIKERFQIGGRIRKLHQYGCCYVYGFGTSALSYNFTLKVL